MRFYLIHIETEEMAKKIVKAGFLWGAFSFLLFSCMTGKQVNLVGVWEVDSLKITMHSLNNSSVDRVLEANGRDWEAKMKVRNIQTHFNPDGTYHSVHKNLQDSIFYDPAGSWNIEGDSIVIQDTIPKRIRYVFKIKIEDEFVEYWGVEDFDQDGKIDDEYYSRQRKLKL